MSANGRVLGFFFAGLGISAVFSAALLVARTEGEVAPAGAAGKAGARPRLSGIGPRVISNQADYPVMIWGERFTPGLRLIVGGGANQAPVPCPTSFVDEHHLTAVIPAGLALLPALSSVELTARLEGPGPQISDGEARIVVANDAAFPTPYAMELFGAPEHPSIAVVSPTTDELYVFAADSEAPAAPLRIGDGPRALATYRDASGAEWLAVAHQRGELRLIEARALAEANAARTSTTAALELPASAQRLIHAAPDLQSLAIDRAARVAYLTSHVLDRIVVVELDTPAVRGTLPAGINPRAIALGENSTLAIAANIASEDVSIVELAGSTERRVRPGPGTPILGGGTEAFSREIMGGKAGRALIYSDKLHAAFMSTIGPNIGPNAERMEVTENGGVSVLDARKGKYLRHVSMLGGVAEGLALDEARGLLYVADGSTGRVAIFDAAKLAAASDAIARKSLLGAFFLPRPPEVPLIRPEEDFGVEGRATLSLHFGAKALRLGEGGRALYVLSRFSGEVLELDTSRAQKGELRVQRTHPAFVHDRQMRRRAGEVIYFTDLGNTGMTCDTCHPEGHAGGVMFSKGKPIRIYRGLTLRGIRESPPYFTPSQLPSIRRTAKNVLSRNRFQNPRSSEEEMDALTEYVGALSWLPNPYVGPLGELPSKLELPGGGAGNAARGLALFEGKAGCASARCHPPPAFTGDQAPATRGALHKLGTPMALMLRPELQDLDVDFGQPPPSLAGVWDTFPLFLSGAGGNEVAADGTIVAEHPFALRWILENPQWSGHGAGRSLSEDERNDLLAYLLTL